MITSVDFLTEPMAPGEERLFTAFADTPMTVAIQCFRKPPDPAQLVPCGECGSYSVSSGDTVVVQASVAVFTRTPGYLRVLVQDSSGDERSFVVQVNNRELEAATVSNTPPILRSY